MTVRSFDRNTQLTGTSGDVACVLRERPGVVQSAERIGPAAQDDLLHAEAETAADRRSAVLRVGVRLFHTLRAATPFASQQECDEQQANET